MKTKSTKVFTVFLLAITVILASVPFASASTLLDDTKVSLDLKCEKAGYTFDVYRVANLESTDTSTFVTRYNSLISSISDEIVNGDSEKLLEKLDTLSSLGNSVKVDSWTSSATSTTKTVSNLEQGVYYIKAVNYPAGVKSVTNSVVALPYFDGTDWIYSTDTIELATKVLDDVPTTEKNITNSIQGNVNYSDVSLGDTVEYELISKTAGSTSMKLNSYIVKDEMSKGLTLNKNSFNVALLDENGDTITNLSSSDYTVNVTSEGDGEDTYFNVSLTSDYLQKDDFYAENVTYTSVTFSAVLNKYAVVGVDGNPNTNKLEYSNKNGVKDEVNGNTVYVYTFGIVVNKLDENNQVMKDAKFALYDELDNANEQTNEIGTSVSDENGVARFYNEAGEELRLQSGTYYVVETEAPEGYNLYGKVIEVTIDVTFGDTFVNNTYITNSPVDGYASINVADTKNVTPNTGGIGNFIVYGIGAAVALVGSAVVSILIRKAKKSK